MHHRLNPPRPLNPLAALGSLAAALLLAACAAQPAPRTAAETPAPAGAQEGPAAAAEAPAAAESAPDAKEQAALAAAREGEQEPVERPAPPAPADGVWLTDEEGAEYYVQEYPKVEGNYFRPEEGKITVAYGLTFFIERETEDFFYLRIYRAEPTYADPAATAEAEAAAQAAAEATAPEVAPIAAGPALTFERYDRGLPDRGQWRNGFAMVDFDGDGRLDVVHGPARKGSQAPWVFLGDGAGGWTPRQLTVPPSVRLDYGDVAVADFNGDGRLDLALGVHLRGLVVLVTTADGGLRPWSEGIEYATPGEAGGGPAEFSSREIAVVDWNRDGRPDLLALGEGPRMMRDPGETRPEFASGGKGAVLFLNRGDGSWERRDQGTSGDQPYGDSLAVGDLDGDGTLDFVTSSSTVGKRNVLHYGQPDGTWRQANLEVPAAVIWAVHLTDLDGDGRAELAIGYLERRGAMWRSRLDLLAPRPDGGFASATLLDEPGQVAVRAIGSGDLEGDGHRDLVAVTDDGSFRVFRGAGGGGIERVEVAGLEPPGFQCSGFQVTLADLDGEPGDEIVAGFAGESGSEQIFPGEQRRFCPGGGALQAWKLAR